MEEREVTETVEEVTEPTSEVIDEQPETVEEQPEPTSEQPVQEPQSVPLEALRDERSKRQLLEQRLQEMIAMAQQQNKPPEQPAQEPVKAPTLEDFDYDEAKYQEAMIDYRVSKRLEAEEQKRQEGEKKQRYQQYVEDYNKRVSTTNEKGKQAHADYEEKVLYNSNLVITRVMADVMSASDIGHDICYHLGSHPEEAAKIAQMPTHMQAAAIGRLEAKLSIKPEKKVTNAPAPIEPVGGSGGQPTIDDDKLTDEEWAKKHMR